MSVGYYSNGYWHPNYWQANYWAPTGAMDQGDYWHANYWNANYWNEDYWLEALTGIVTQNNAAVLPLSPQNPTLNIGLGVQATTPTLALAPQATDANLDIDPAITAPTLALTPANAVVGLGGYQAGDIDLFWVPDSTITVTLDVQQLTVPELPLAPMVQTVEVEGGVVVAQGAPPVLGFTNFPHTAQLNISVEPLPPTLPIASFDTTAGIGNQVPATQPTLGFTVATHTIVAFERDPGAVNATTALLPLTAVNPTVVAFAPSVITMSDVGLSSTRGADINLSEEAA